MGLQRVTQLWINWRQALLTKSVRNCICQQNRLMCLGKRGRSEHISPETMTENLFLNCYFLLIEPLRINISVSQISLENCLWFRTSVAQDPPPPPSTCGVLKCPCCELGMIWILISHPNYGHITARTIWPGISMKMIKSFNVKVVTREVKYYGRAAEDVTVLTDWFAEFVAMQRQTNIP